MDEYELRVNAAGVQYLVELLKTRTIGEAGMLFESIRAQVQTQEAAAAQRERDAIKAQALAEREAMTNVVPQ